MAFFYPLSPRGKCISNEKADECLLLFVLKAVDKPEETDLKDVADLRELGWTDQEIIEATIYGADMVWHGILFKAFNMDED